MKKNYANRMVTHKIQKMTLEKLEDNKKNHSTEKELKHENLGIQNTKHKDN